jgi:hypothetical protein
MPIQELAPVTLNEVLEDISRFEDEFEVTSADFLNIGANIPDDDAAEWRYLLAQKEALATASLTSVLPTVQGACRSWPITYSATKGTYKRSGVPVDERRQQYDCAA